MTEEVEAGEAEAPTSDAEAAPPEPQANPFDGLPEDLKGYVETKGFKDTASLADSYRNLEKMRGVPQERLLTLPEDMTEDGALDPVYDKLGRPESPDKYTNAVGEELTDDVYTAMAEEAHKAGLTDGQFAKMQERFKGLATNLETQRQQEIDSAFDNWSKENPRALESAKRFSAAMNVDDATMDKALGGDKVALFDLLGKAGARIGEKSSIQGDGDPELSMSPEAARAKIDQLMGDKTFTDQYFSDNPKMRQPAMKRMETLQKVAAGDK